MQEVIGSNPLSSTLIIKGLRASVNPFLLGLIKVVEACWLFGFATGNL